MFLLLLYRHHHTHRNCRRCCCFSWSFHFTWKFSSSSASVTGFVLQTPSICFCFKSSIDRIVLLPSHTVPSSRVPSFMTCCSRQFLVIMYPVQLAFLRRITVLEDTINQLWLCFFVSNFVCVHTSFIRQ